MVAESAVEKGVRLLLTAFFALMTVALLLLAPITGLTSVPFAIVTGGLTHGLSEVDPDGSTPKAAKAVMKLGLALVLGEVLLFVIVASLRS